MSRARQASVRSSVEVVVDVDFLPEAQLAGYLHFSSGLFSFEFDAAWLRSRHAISFDPHLQLFSGLQYPVQKRFGIFMDSAPDRWGQVLLERREHLRAREEKRPVRALMDWDFLMGVHDACRLGALRFRKTTDSPFLDDDKAVAAPPLTSLRELQAISLEVENPASVDHPHYKSWLMALLAPGTSLGGARPKANFTDTDGSLWIAKFPSRNDRRNVGAWEYLAHQLASRAGLNMAEARLHQFGGEYGTFACRRFDRNASHRRRLFVSAMTLLGKQDGEPASYLDLAEFIQNHGSRKHLKDDLRELMRRLLFNLAISNRDDHLRNHGFIHDGSGWRLSPAYDLNPNVEKLGHALRIDEHSSEPDVKVAKSCREFFRLSELELERLVEDVRRSVSDWEPLAKALHLPSIERDQMRPAFLGASPDF